MKKGLIAFLILLIVFLSAVYLFIPKQLEIRKTAYVNAVADATYRQVSEKTAWKRWWPQDTSADKAMHASQPEKFFYEGIGYSVTSHVLGPIQVLITTEGNEFNSTLLTVPITKDSSALTWRCLIETGINPFEKIKYYRQSKNIAAGMDKILDSLQSFLSRQDNLYNIPITRTRVTDTILITTKIILDHYPSTGEIYHSINKLKQYISSQGAKETNYPMLHVLRTDSTRFETMIAIPVNKRIGNDAEFVHKRMVPGNILLARVRGGHHNIQRAFAEMETYVKDHELIPPAISFQSLETDRLGEPDTTKWITRIYFPVL